MSLQEDIIAQLGVKPVIDPQEEIRRSIDFLKDYLQKHPFLKTFVLGISGGQDSTLAGRLAQLAMEEMRAETGDASYQFVAVRLPYGVQADEADAQKALAFIQPDVSLVVNIKESVDAMERAVEATGTDVSDFNKVELDAEIEADSETDTDALSETDVDATFSSETDSDTEVVPRTTLSASAIVSLSNSDAVVFSAPVSSACAAVVTTAPPRIDPTAMIPFNTVRLEDSVIFRLSSATSATTNSSTWPRTTLNRPRLEVAARSQFLPDLINLKRVTRSVSRNDPFERLKNINTILL